MRSSASSPPRCDAAHEPAHNGVQALAEQVATIVARELPIVSVYGAGSSTRSASLALERALARDGHVVVPFTTSGVAFPVNEAHSNAPAPQPAVVLPPDAAPIAVRGAVTNAVRRAGAPAASSEGSVLSKWEVPIAVLVDDVAAAGAPLGVVHSLVRALAPVRVAHVVNPADPTRASAFEQLWRSLGFSRIRLDPTSTTSASRTVSAWRHAERDAAWTERQQVLRRVHTSLSALGAGELGVIAKWLETFVANHQATCVTGGLDPSESTHLISAKLPHVPRPLPTKVEDAVALFAHRLPVVLSDPAWCLVCVGTTRRPLRIAFVQDQVRALQSLPRVPWYSPALPAGGATTIDDGTNDDMLVASLRDDLSHVLKYRRQVRALANINTDDPTRETTSSSEDDGGVTGTRSSRPSSPRSVSHSQPRCAHGTTHRPPSPRASSPATSPRSASGRRAWPTSGAHQPPHPDESPAVAPPAPQRPLAFSEHVALITSGDAAAVDGVARAFGPVVSALVPARHDVSGMRIITAGGGGGSLSHNKQQTASPSSPPPRDVVATPQHLWWRFLLGLTAGEVDTNSAFAGSCYGAAPALLRGDPAHELRADSHPSPTNAAGVDLPAGSPPQSPRQGSASPTGGGSRRPLSNSRPALRAPTIVVMPTAAFAELQALWANATLPDPAAGLAFVVDQLVAVHRAASSSSSSSSSATQRPDGRATAAAGASADAAAAVSAPRPSLAEGSLAVALPSAPSGAVGQESAGLPRTSLRAPVMHFESIEEFSQMHRSRFETRTLAMLGPNAATLDHVLEHGFAKRKQQALVPWPQTLQRHCRLPHGFLRDAGRALVRFELHDAFHLRAIDDDVLARATSLKSIVIANATNLRSIGSRFAAECPLLESVRLEHCLKLKTLGDEFVARSAVLRCVRFERCAIGAVGADFVADGGRLPAPTLRRWEVVGCPHITPPASRRAFTRLEWARATDSDARQTLETPPEIGADTWRPFSRGQGPRFFRGTLGLVLSFSFANNAKPSGSCQGGAAVEDMETMEWLAPL
jgi:hypothetical protein